MGLQQKGYSRRRRFVFSLLFLFLVMFPSRIVLGQHRACSATIKPWRGFPSLYVDGEPQYPIAFLMHEGDFSKNYRQMASVGIRFFTTAAPIGNTPSGFNPANCDEPFLMILREQPHALIFPRVDITAPPWWLEQHPEERVIFDDGSVGPQSMFSEIWLRDACEWIESYARYIRHTEYSKSVLGLHICSGYTGEWQAWGLWDGKRGDHSSAAIRAWRDYLKSKYKTEDKLSKAWGRTVSFAEVDIPSREKREQIEQLLRSIPEFQDCVDFYDFWWRGTARAITQVAAAAKRGGGQDWLVGVFYGYLLQHGGKIQESQHLGMRAVIDCPDIDFFCSPGMYTKRQLGGTSTFMSCVDSIRLRGKYWFHEADNRTHLANDPVSPARNLFETLQVLKREFANAWTHHVGIWWFDMQGGWYDDEKILELFRQMVEWANMPRDHVWEPTVEVSVFVDDKSTYRMRAEEPYLSRNIPEILADMPRLGAPYHVYLLKDITRFVENCPYKLCIFPNAFDLTQEEYRALTTLRLKNVHMVFGGPAIAAIIRDGTIEQEIKYAVNLLGFSPQREEQETYVNEIDGMYWFKDTPFDMKMMKMIAKNAGVFLYSSSLDAFYVGNGLFALHAVADDDAEVERVVRFPVKVRCKELFSESSRTFEGKELCISLNPVETRCFWINEIND